MHRVDRELVGAADLIRDLLPELPLVRGVWHVIERTIEDTTPDRAEAESELLATLPEHLPGEAIVHEC
jgi:hypothetical protein